MHGISVWSFPWTLPFSGLLRRAWRPNFHQVGKNTRTTKGILTIIAHPQTKLHGLTLVMSNSGKCTTISAPCVKQKPCQTLDPRTLCQYAGNRRHSAEVPQSRNSNHYHPRPHELLQPVETGSHEEGNKEDLAPREPL